MCKDKCGTKGKCCHAFDKAKDLPQPPTPPANDHKSPHPAKKKCCGGTCHPKK